ncbi:MAG: rhodanese-like domain-containing protein [Leptothrix ochracea]
MKFFSNPAMPRRHLLQRTAAVVLGSTLVSAAWAQANATTTNNGNSKFVDLETVRATLKEGKVPVFDIREPAEHATGVAAGARLLPMSQIGARLAEIPKDQPVLLMCNTQNRSRKVAEALWERGYTHVRYVQGGMSQWTANGWPKVPPTQR